VTSHSNKIIETGLLFNPTSKKADIDIRVVIIMLKLLIIRDPYIPDILPKNPEIIDPNNGNNMIDKYIIYILLLYFLLIYKKQLKLPILWLIQLQQL
jgi:hypothetical protein